MGVPKRQHRDSRPSGKSDRKVKRFKNDETSSNDSGLEFIDGERLCEVEKVLSKQIKRDGTVHYLLKWRNYKGEPTWEPRNNCACYKLIDEFETVVAKRQKALDIAEHDDDDEIDNTKSSRGHSSQTLPKQDKKLKSINGKLVKNTHTKSVMRSKKVKRSFSKPCPLSKKRLYNN